MSVNASRECHSRAYTMAVGGLGPHMLMCKCSLVSAPLNQCTIKLSKHLGFPPLLIFALLFGHLRCNHTPRTESHRTSGMQLTLLLPPRTSVTCLRPCDQVGKRSNQMSCFSVLTESQSTTLHCIGEVSAGFSEKKKLRLWTESHLESSRSRGGLLGFCRERWKNELCPFWDRKTDFITDLGAIYVLFSHWIRLGSAETIPPLLSPKGWSSELMAVLAEACSLALSKYSSSSKHSCSSGAWWNGSTPTQKVACSFRETLMLNRMGIK